MKASKKILKASIGDLADEWLIFSNTTAIFFGGDEIRLFKVAQKRTRAILKVVLIALVSIAVLISIFVLTANKTVAKESSHPVYKYAPLLKGGSQRQQDIIAFAWDISQDPDWIATLFAENGTFEENRIGVSGDVGLCQLNPRYHWGFIHSPEFQDYRQQLLYCAEIYSRASAKGCISCTFHGYNNKERAKNAFIWQ